jgi:hypothetical protein
VRIGYSILSLITRMADPVKWRPSDWIALIVASTVSLCLLIFVCGVTLSVANGKLTAELLGGPTKGAALGSGLVGFGSIFSVILLKVLKNGR